MVIISAHTLTESSALTRRPSPGTKELLQVQLLVVVQAALSDPTLTREHLSVFQSWSLA